jgi:uncharacterized protein (DUF2062 family)
MARRLIKRWLPDPYKVRDHKHLRFFGTLLHDPNLWHLNRHSVSDAFAVGLFMAFVPMPFQMIPAAALAIYLRANLPIAVALVWITNPFTMAPISYFCYLLGTWILDTPPQPFAFEPTWDWISWELKRIWQPFLLGSLVVASLASLAGYWLIRGLWRWNVVRDWGRRKGRRPRASR